MPAAKPSVRFVFFELKTPQDLFRKLEGDFAELEASYQDTRSAFNFFVTAEHLPDWLNQRPLVHKTPLLRIVSHLANGAKHFEIDGDRHSSVESGEKERYFAEDYCEPGYVEEPLTIHLTQEEAVEFGMTTIDALALGRMVLDFWRPYVASNASAAP